MMDLKFMDRKWLADCSPEYVGSAESMKAFCLRSSDKIEPKSEIELPSPFQTFIHEKFYFPRRDGSTRIIYIRLNAIDYL